MIGATAAVVAPVVSLAWRVATFTPPHRAPLDPLTARTMPPGRTKPDDLRALASQGPGELAGAALGGEAWAGEPAGLKPMPELARRVLGVRRSLGGEVEELVHWEAQASPESVRGHYEAEAARLGFKPVTTAKPGAGPGAAWSRAFARASPDGQSGSQTLVVRVGAPRAVERGQGEAVRITLWLRYATASRPGDAADRQAREPDQR